MSRQQASWRQTLRRGVIAGAGFGLAMAVAETCLGVIGLSIIGIGAPLSMMASAIVLHTLLGALLGIAMSPCLRLRRG